MGDLFAPAPAEADWRNCADPHRRLAGFAADPAVPMPQRRQAAEALARATAQAPVFPHHAVRTLGMLMLVP
jgi:hypothetical protein